MTASTVDIRWTRARRKYEVRQQPYYGAKGATRPLCRNALAPPFEPPTAGARNTHSYVVPGWGQVVVCRGCDGHKTVQCSGCRGSKRVSCGSCFGGRVQGKNGRINCPRCRGTNRMKCGRCEGRGKVDCRECAGHGKCEISHHFEDKYSSHAHTDALNQSGLSAAVLRRQNGTLYWQGRVVDVVSFSEPGGIDANGPPDRPRVGALVPLLPNIVKPGRNDFICQVDVHWVDFQYREVVYKAYGSERTCFIFRDGNVVGEFGWLGTSAGTRRLVAWVLKIFTGNDRIAEATITLCAAMAWADGELHENERTLIHELIVNAKLSKKRRATLLEYLKAAPPTELTISDRRDCGAALGLAARVAFADGRLDDSELSKFYRIGAQFGFAPEELSGILVQVEREMAVAPTQAAVERSPVA